MYKIITLFTLCFTLIFADDNTTEVLDTMVVQAKEDKSIFYQQDYIQSQTFMEEAPSQRKLSILEAMNIPGIQGDPIKAMKILAGVTSAGSSGELIVHASKSSETELLTTWIFVSFSRSAFCYFT